MGAIRVLADVVVSATRFELRVGGTHDQHDA